MVEIYPALPALSNLEQGTFPLRVPLLDDHIQIDNMAVTPDMLHPFTAVISSGCIKLSRQNHEPFNVDVITKSNNETGKATEWKVLFSRPIGRLTISNLCSESHVWGVEDSSEVSVIPGSEVVLADLASVLGMHLLRKQNERKDPTLRRKLLKQF